MIIIINIINIIEKNKVLDQGQDNFFFSFRFNLYSLFLALECANPITWSIELVVGYSRLFLSTGKMSCLCQKLLFTLSFSGTILNQIMIFDYYYYYYRYVIWREKLGIGKFLSKHLTKIELWRNEIIHIHIHIHIYTYLPSNIRWIDRSRFTLPFRVIFTHTTHSSYIWLEFVRFDTQQISIDSSLFFFHLLFWFEFKIIQSNAPIHALILIYLEG